MPAIERPGGITIAWDEVGSGPTVVFADQPFSPPDIYEALRTDLARDHRLVSYDMRGMGASTREGPYNLETDVDDLVAVLEAIGGADVLIGFSDGCHRAVKAAARRSELTAAVISPAGNPLGRDILATDGLAASDGVVDALQQMLKTDYRAALRTMITSINPEMDIDEVRDRIDRTIEYAPQEQAAARFQEWVMAEAREEALALGDRLWLIISPNVFFRGTIAAPTRELLPEANVLEVDEGAISAPQHTTKVVRELTKTRSRA